MPNPRRWVVVGEEGEYSDRSVWAVAVFPDKALAQAFVDKLSAYVRVAAGDGRTRPRTSVEERERARLLVHEMDPAIGVGGRLYDPPTYWLEEVPEITSLEVEP